MHRIIITKSARVLLDDNNNVKKLHIKIPLKDDNGKDIFEHDIVEIKLSHKDAEIKVAGIIKSFLYMVGENYEKLLDNMEGPVPVFWGLVNRFGIFNIFTGIAPNHKIDPLRFNPFVKSITVIGDEFTTPELFKELDWLLPTIKKEDSKKNEAH